jgi:hypothetical protein
MNYNVTWFVNHATLKGRGNRDVWRHGILLGLGGEVIMPLICISLNISDPGPWCLLNRDQLLDLQLKKIKIWYEFSMEKGISQYTYRVVTPQTPIAYLYMDYDKEER